MLCNKNDDISNEFETNILGYEKIGKLVKMYAIPSVISILVNALYNIVDQIFIGWGVGYLGNGATNVVFPITIVFASFALMFGDGSAAYLSLKLGAQKKDEASQGIGNGILLSIVTSIIFSIFVLMFLPQLLRFFGCIPSLEQYAKAYGYIIVIGLPFMMIGTTINSIIRADGNPRYAMMTMFTGAILNIILDPIFIFIFHLGVSGAALATIISQIISFILNYRYLKKLQTVDIKKCFQFDITIAKKVMSLGISSFVTQMSGALIMGIQNNLLVKYGALSIYGSEIPITVLGIVMKINEIINSIVLGLAMGSQPIIGYNYGAKNFDRVKETLKIVITISLLLSLVIFVLFQTIPKQLILLFGNSENPLYLEFAQLSFRVYLLFIIGNGFQIPVSIFLQAIGKSVKSACLSMTRQIIVFIPCMLLFGHLFGIVGVLSARPFSETIAFLLSVILFIIELRIMHRYTNKQRQS